MDGLGRRLARLVGRGTAYHAPVFVLTHHEREPVEMAGGTTFHFVTDGFDAAYGRAVEAAGEEGEILHRRRRPRRSAKALAAGVLDELLPRHLAPSSSAAASAFSTAWSTRASRRSR